MALFIGFMSSCGTDNVSDKVYNQGINLIPAPVSLQQQEGKFTLTSNAIFKINNAEAGKVAAFFANKLKTSTGFNLKLSETEGNIVINVDPSLAMNEEGYKLKVLHRLSKLLLKQRQELFMVCKQSFNCFLPK